MGELQRQAFHKLVASWGIDPDKLPPPEPEEPPTPDCKPWCRTSLFRKGYRDRGPGFLPTAPNDPARTTWAERLAAVDYEYCPCPKGQEAQARHEAGRVGFMAKAAGIGPDERRYTLETYLAEVPGAKPSVVNRLRQWQATEPRPNLILWSVNPGLAKTGLGIALLMDEIRRGVQPRYLVAPDFLESLRRSMDGGTVGADEIMATVASWPLLLWDDVGKAAMTPWGQEKTWTLVNERTRLKLPTIVTSNLAPTKLAGHFGIYSADRLIGGCRDPHGGKPFILELSGESVRGRI